MRTYILIAIFIVIAGLGCATSKGDGSKARSSYNRLSLDDIQMSRAENAYKLVESLRPQWLRTRGNISFVNEQAGSPVVYLDGGRYGNIRSLVTLSPAGIQEIRFLNTNEATLKFGTAHKGPVILITSR